MQLARFALANLNSTVGAVRANVDKAVELARAAAEDHASLVAFPEQSIGGYGAEDLVQWRRFVEAQWEGLEALAARTSSLACAIAVGLVVQRRSHIYNVAALVHRGRVLGLVPKEKLPLYNVFYEARTLARGASGLYDEVRGVPFGDLVFELDFGTVALEVCEDLWSADGPMRRRSHAGAEVVVNLSASPFRVGVVETRREVVATRAGDNQATVVYANLVGANDGLIFDGGGFVAQNGRIVHDGPRFREGISAATVDLARTRRLRVENSTWRADQESFAEREPTVRRVRAAGPTASAQPLAYPAPSHKSFFLPLERARRSERAAFCEDLLDALALGIGDYFEKSGAFKTIGVSLSGGRDSLLCLVLARRYVSARYGALGPDGEAERASALLRAFYFPSRFSSAETAAAAEQAARDLGVPFVSQSIDDAFAREVAAIEALLQPGEAVTALAKQNVQARLRAERMWTWANSAGGLFLQTSNMSEKAAGYTTIGGDMEGALSVVANVPKTVVNYLLDYLHEQTGWAGIELTLKKPASAELAEDQEDERDLMPFPVLDACFYLYANEKMPREDVALALSTMFPEHDRARLDAWTERFVRLFTQSIYKWVQTPLSLHVGHLDLDRERALQLPVIQRPEWHG